MKTMYRIAGAAVFAAFFTACGAGAQEEVQSGERTRSQESGSDNGFEVADVPDIDASVLTGGLPISVQQAPDYREARLPAELQGQEPPSAAEGAFTTDFSRAAVSYTEIMSGGPGKDGIPAVDEPRFISIEEAKQWLEPKEPVMIAGYRNAGIAGDGQQRGELRVYPLQILMWHEIVNDTVGGVPVAVTYCPLCNTGIVFLRRYDGRTLDFGTTGRLRHSNLIMYDRQTESWWQQASGKGLAGRYAGGSLRMLPALTLSWEEARSRYPEAEVLSRKTGYSRPYGRNPYSGYDTAERPFLYRGPDIEGNRDMMERVHAVQVNGEWKAFSYGRLRRERVVQTSVGGRSVVILWEPGQASALDTPVIAEGRDVGSANGFIPKAEGRSLDFRFEDGQITDRQTGSRWDTSGTAVSGPLAGHRLEPVPGTGHFWFSWNAFRDTER
jgi:hypothetical protein